MAAPRASTTATADRTAPTARLWYSLGAGAEACPAETDVRRRVTARLGYAPWSDRALRTVIASVTRIDAGLVARVEVLDAQGRTAGTRTLRDQRDDCRELAGALQLAIGIAVDPLGVGRGSTPRPARESPGPAPPTLASSPAEKPTANPSSPLRVGVAAHVGGVAAAGSAPGITAGVTFGARVSLGAVSLGLEGRYDAPAFKDVAGGGEISGALLALSVLPCVHVRWFVGCGLLSQGVVFAEGRGLRDAQSATVAHVAAGARAAAEIPIVGRLSLRAHLDFMAHFFRASFESTGGTEVYWRAPPVAGTLGVAAVVKLR